MSFERSFSRRVSFSLLATAKAALASEDWPIFWYHRPRR